MIHRLSILSEGLSGAVGEKNLRQVCRIDADCSSTFGTFVAEDVAALGGPGRTPLERVRNGWRRQHDCHGVWIIFVIPTYRILLCKPMARIYSCVHQSGAALPFLPLLTLLLILYSCYSIILFMVDYHHYCHSCVTISVILMI